MNETMKIRLAGRECFLNLDPSELTQRHILASSSQNGGKYEPETTSVFLEVLKYGDYVIDIGAHVGYFSVLSGSLVGNSGMVLSAEPDTKNYDALCRNVELNHMESVINPMNVVVSDFNGEVDFHVNLDNDGGHALWNPALHPFNKKTKEHPGTRKVRSVTVETLFDVYEMRNVRLMKIDTEGAEVLVLSGAFEPLSNKRVQNVICEVHSDGLGLLGSSREELFWIMKNHGYKHTTLGEIEEGSVYNVLFYL